MSTITYQRVYRENNILEEVTLTPSGSNQTASLGKDKFAVKQIHIKPIIEESFSGEPIEGNNQTYAPTNGTFYTEAAIKRIPEEYLIPQGVVFAASNGNYDVRESKEIKVVTGADEWEPYTGGYTVIEIEGE